MYNEHIAIIGISSRFPQGETLAAFWDLLSNGVDAVTESTRHQVGGFLDNIDCFDAEFFNISPQEAALIDPQQRLLLETTWSAIEDAGIIPKSLAGSDTGVFIGIGNRDYSKLIDETKVNSFAVTTGNSTSIAANRISYYFDWHGPSMVINTACSSALVAIDRACRSLWTQESSLALAGGANLILSPQSTTRFKQGGLIAADGRCKVFDAKADGYVQSEGVGMVVLKPLNQAQADGDRIYAVIIGSGVNHNGRSNTLTSPNLQAQVMLLNKVYQQAKIDPQTIHYVETHATGTPIGDALELKALGKILGKNRPKDNPCSIGSVKTNLGHTEAVSGIAGLIKIILCLQHRQLVPNLHFQQPNSAVDFAKLRLKVQQIREDLQEIKSPLRMAVSAFGFGGTNAHLVLEEAPIAQTPVDTSVLPVHIFTISAQSETALLDLAKRYEQLLTQDLPISLGNLCYNTNTKRESFNYRLFIVTESVEQLRNYLDIFVQHKTADFVFTSKINKRLPQIDPLEKVAENSNLLETLAQVGNLWLKGHEINWNSLYAASNYQYISLPTYPFQKQRYWFSDDLTKVEISNQDNTQETQNYSDNHIESQLQEIWRDLLNKKNITPQDNFFALGGTSLLTVDLCVKIQDVFNKKISPASVFEFPTIQDLAQVILGNQEVNNSSLTITNFKETNKTIITINSFNESNSLANQNLSERYSVCNLNIFKFSEEIKKQICEINSEKVIELIAKKMVDDLCKAKLKQPYQLLSYCGEAILTLEIAKQLKEQNHEVDSIILIDGIFKNYQPSFKERYRAFQQLGLDYIYLKTKNVTNKIRNRKKLLVDNNTKKTRANSPDQMFYKAYLLGRTKYSLKSYSGKIILLLSTEWKYADLSLINQIAPKNLEIHEIIGLHHYLFKKPYVEPLVNTILQIID